MYFRTSIPLFYIKPLSFSNDDSFRIISWLAVGVTRLTFLEARKSLWVRPTVAALDLRRTYHSLRVGSSSRSSAVVCSESFFMSRIKSLSSARIFRWSLQCFRREPTRAARGRNLCHFCPVWSIAACNSHWVRYGHSEVELSARLWLEFKQLRINTHRLWFQCFCTLCTLCTYNISL